MADTLRTALKGGGDLRVEIRLELSGDIEITVHEDWARLDAWRQARITAERLNAEPDPDKLITEATTAMVRDCHINYEARKPFAAEMVRYGGRNPWT
uniref:Uncharacterized protein n=1 Tax=Dulem virus 34 TaxID=3145752 RepID=A0AAU8B531_9CAUD